MKFSLARKSVSRATHFTVSVICSTHISAFQRNLKATDGPPTDNEKGSKKVLRMYGATEFNCWKAFKFT